MTPVYRAMLNDLHFHVTFLPGSWDKRFVRDLASALAADLVETRRQRAQILRLVQRYRRQLPESIVEAALLEREFSETWGKFSMFDDRTADLSEKPPPNRKGRRAVDSQRRKGGTTQAELFAR